MKVQVGVTNLTAGEVTPRLDGRPDVSKQRNGLRICENFQVVVHGGARKRSGTQFVCEVPNEEQILHPFNYSTEDSYMLIWGPGYVWIAKDRGMLTEEQDLIQSVTQSNPAVITTTSPHGFQNGDKILITGVNGMVQLNNRIFTVANRTTTTFQLQGENSSSYLPFAAGSGSASKLVTVTTPYTAADLQELRFAQFNDVLYVTHRNYALRKLSRLSNTSWTFGTVSITTGPFRSINGDATRNMTIGLLSGAPTSFGTFAVGASVFLDAPWGPFLPQHVGSLWRLSEAGGGPAVSGAPLGSSVAVSVGQLYTEGGNVYGVSAASASNWARHNRVPEHDSGTVRMVGADGTYIDSAFLHPGYAVVQVTQYINSTQMYGVVVRYQMPASIVTSGTTFWEEGAWSALRGFPRCCAFFEQRLWLGGSDSEPAAVWASASSAFENFQDGPDDDDAIVYRAASGYADTIRWLSGGRVLTAGTSHGEYAIAASNQNEALTPSNLRMLLQTTYGTSDCPPIRVNDVVLYPQRNGNPNNAARKLREFQYEYTSDLFNSIDMTIFAEHITGEGVTRIAYAMQPEAMIWGVRTDGQMPVCAYERLQEVVGWFRTKLGGTDAQAKSISVCPGANGDDVWILATRTVGGRSAKFLEVFHPPFEPTRDAKEDAKFLDAMLTYSGTSTSTITGLWHLRGSDVTILNNGNVETGTVAQDGTLTLARATTKAHIGLPYTAILETQELEAGAQAGTAQGTMKRISQVRTRLLGSLGGSIGPPEKAGDLDPFVYRTEYDVMGSTPPLFSGLIETDFKGKHDREARIRIEHSEPLPMFITALVAEQSAVG